MQLCIPVTESSQPAAARRAAAKLAQGAGLNERETGSLSLLVTELATNLVKHATDGLLLMRRVEADDSMGVEILSLDKGPGIADVAKALRDGYSTAGSSGTGLGALIRAAGVFDLYSQPNKGTAVVVRLWPGDDHGGRAAARPVGVVHQPKPGETVCGDDWLVRQFSDGWTCAVADGLGHGLSARDATRPIMHIVASTKATRPIQLLAAAHEAAKPTRGAACAFAISDGQAGVVRFAGVGNITAVVLEGANRRHLVSSNGILGHSLNTLTEFSQPWRKQSVLLMHSDGIGTHWDMNEYPGLLARDPSLIAGVLYRDHARGRDDATVVVLKEESS